MELSDATSNKIKGLLYENREEEAKAALIEELAITEEEAMSYLERLRPSMNVPSSTPSTKKKSGKTLAIIFTVIGLILVSLAIYFAVDKQQMLKSFASATGTVTDFRVDDGDEMYAPIVEYSYEGQQYTYKSGTYSNPPAYDLNEQVAIFVNPENPQDIIIDSFMSKWLAVVILGSIGALCLIFGVLTFFVKGTSGGIDMLSDDDD